MFVLPIGLLVLCQAVLAPFAAPAALPQELPDVSAWESVSGEALLCAGEGTAPVSAPDFRSVYPVLAGLSICRTDDTVPPAAMVSYTLYVAPKGYRGYSVVRFSFDIPAHGFARDTVSWTPDGKKFSYYIALVGKWRNAAWNKDLVRDIEYCNIWTINLHNRLLHERDNGNLEKPRP